MTTEVLVPLDGSDKDERALTAASAMAELTGGNLRLIRVLDTPIASLSDRARTMGVLDAAREVRAGMERGLAEWAARLRASTGRQVNAEVAEAFDVAQFLVDRSAESGISFVVMATRAAGALGRAIRGSVADRVMRESARPVFLVPPGADNMRAYKIRLQRVLIPLDGSALALAAVDRLLALEKGRNLEYVLLEVVTTAFSGTKLESFYSPSVPEPSSGARADRSEPAQTRLTAGEELQRVAARLHSGGATAIQIRVIENHDPVTAINRVAKSESVDFIAMSTRGLSGVTRLVAGSVAEGVVRASDVPVLLFAPSDLSMQET